MKYIYILLIVVLLIGGCTKVIVPANTATGNDDNSNDNGDTSNTDTGSVPRVCTEAINYQILIDALPTDMAGYVADEPEGNTLSFQDPSTQKTTQYSTASVTLSNEDKYIEVSATDTCYVQFLSAAWLGFYEMDGTQGFLKKTTIDGYPGWHQYDKSSEAYSYNIFVADRVMVSIQGSNGVPDSDVEAVARAIGYSDIAAAAE